MKAYVTSIGEATTDLCVWSLQRSGFDVELIQDKTTLWDKLNRIYNKADHDFVRVDADVVPNKMLTPQAVNLAGANISWWLQFQTFDWHKQGLSWGGIQFIRKEALPYLRDSADKFSDKIRPETELTRIPQFYSPRRFESIPDVMGLHGYKATDLKRVKELKAMRNQSPNYDWELEERLNALI